MIFAIDVKKRFLRFYFFFINKNAFNVFYLCSVFVNKNTLTSVTCQLANYALETLALLLEWCERTPQFSSLSLSGGSSAYIIAMHPNLTAFAPYNHHAFYNIDILIKLLTFFSQHL